MRESHVRHLLAIWRELDDETRDHVEEHLSTCIACRAERQVFREQDILLSDLPTVRTRSAWQNQVRARIHAAPRRRRLPLGQQAGLLLALLVICVVMSVGTVAVSAAALPGDLLYPVKRTVEQMNLMVIQSDEREKQYLLELAERRRAEVRRVLELQRQVSLQFDGVLQQYHAGQWSIDGIPVQIDPAAVTDAGIEAGDIVRVDGLATRGELQVLRIRGEEAPPAPADGAPTSTGTPAHAPSATATEEAPAGPDEGTSTPMPTVQADPSTSTPWPTMAATRMRPAERTAQSMRTAEWPG